MSNDTHKAGLLRRLDRIQELTDQLAKVQRDLIERQDLAARIHREIEAARDALVLERPS